MLRNHLERGCWFAGGTEPDSLDKMMKVCKIKDMKTEPATQSDDFVSLYGRACKEFGSRALWNVRELEDPSPKDALVIARYLRVEGNLEARRLAERIERVCHAAH